MITLHFIKNDRGNAICKSQSTNLTMLQSATTCPQCLVLLGVFSEPEKKPRKKAVTS